MARSFVFEDTKRHDYRYIRQGLLRRGWKQINLPQRAQPSSKLDRKPSWVCHGGTMGVSCVGQKGVTCPDLIWTLSCGRSPGLGSFGPHQATNFFVESLCLTTKAGLCRLLQGTECSKRHEDVGPEYFFPRCFDLSDSSQLEDFKENFRQTAAAVVLKVFCRLLEESTSRPASTSPAEKSAQLNVGKADSMRHTPSHKCGSMEGCVGMGCQGYVHPWMLALAVRACRRRLLEMSGWQEDHTGHKKDSPSGANGAESLTNREWESLLLYSYSLRRVAIGATIRDCGQLSDDDRELKELEEDVPGCPAGVGLRGARGLRGIRAGNVRENISKRARRPSSAPAERSCGKLSSQRRQPLSHSPTIASNTTLSTANRRDRHITAPVNSGAAEAGDVQKGIVRARSPSKSSQSTGCESLHGVEAEREWKSRYKSRLALEAKQLCATFERRCPQWTIDGERNLWVLKPAGASRGQGVRVAWTLDQILCAQKTMGGRVAQKYVETPLLLPCCSREPQQQSNDSACLDRGIRRRRRLELRRGSTHGGRESCAKPRRWAEANKTQARSRDTCEPVETCSDPPNVVEKESEISKGASPPSGGPADDAHRIAGDTGNIGINRQTSERKFDIRVWVLVTGWDPVEAFVFDEGYLRVCPQNFSLEKSKFAEPRVHLTNLSARRQNKPNFKAWDDQFQRQEEGQRRRRLSSAGAFRALNRDEEGVRGPTDPTTSEVEIDGFLASQSELIKRLGEMDEPWDEGGTKGRREEDIRARGERIWKTKVSPSVEGVVRKTLLAAQPHMRPRAPSFQLFGFDILLDRDLRPWLLEVNLSPALSHSSKRQSRIISSMCEGLLRLTVDRIFPAPPPPASNVEREDGSFDSDTRTSMDASGSPVSRSSKVPVKRALHFGTWRQITKAPSPSSRKRNQGPSTPSDERVSVRNPSAQVFTLTGRRLTRRSLARAERGVREATAVRMLTVWWRSIADECREARSRKLWAMAQISTWAITIVARRRRKALRSKSERSARVIQARWRRATELRSLAAHMAACTVVQMAWRKWQCERRCASRRVRWKAFWGLQSWARSILSRRQNRARETILRMVAAAKSRHATKRHAAALIVRGLGTTCDRRRQSRLRLQRFARMPCLCRVRLAALSLARVDRTKNGAATIIARAFRRALARPSMVCAASAARTRQVWSRRVLWRWEKRVAPIVTFQRAYRQRRIRRSFAVAEQTVEAVAGGTSTVPSVPVCAVEPEKLLALDDIAVLDTSVSENVGQLSPRRPANSVPLVGHSCASHCSPPDVLMEGDKKHSLRVPDNGEHGTSSASCGQLVSPATTARETWSDPDLCLADGSAQSCQSHVSRGGSLSYYNEAHRRATSTAVVMARRSAPRSERRASRAAIRREGGEARAAEESSGGLLDLENILPDFIKRHPRATPSEGKQRGWPGSSPQDCKQSKGVPCRAIEDGSRELDDGRTTPAFCSREERLPYPPAGGTQPIVSRAQQHWGTRQWARTHQFGEGRVGAAMKPAPKFVHQGNHRDEAAGRFHRSRPRNSGCRSAPKRDDRSNSGFRRNRIPSKKEVSSGGTGATSRRSRAGPSSGRASANKAAKMGMGARGAGDGVGGSIRWKGESGGVLEMLAFMEA